MLCDQRGEEPRQQTVLLTSVLSRGAKDKGRARAPGRTLRAIRTEIVGPFNKGVLHMFYVLSTTHVGV